MVFSDPPLMDQGIEGFLHFLRTGVEFVQKQDIRLFSGDHLRRKKFRCLAPDLRNADDILRRELASKERHTRQADFICEFSTNADFPMPGAPQIKTGRTGAT